MKLVKRFFKTKILLWKVVGIGLIALLGLVLGLYISFSKANSESNQTTNTYSTIKKIEKGHCTHKMRHKKTLLLKSGKLETGVFCYGQKSIFSRN